MIPLPGVSIRVITDTVDENPKRTQEQVEKLLLKKKPAWREGYDYLMATKAGAQYWDVLLAVWLSVGKDDRGVLQTRDDFARFIGVSRAVTYQWQTRRPEIVEWARELIELRFGGTRLANVDERVYQKASSRSATVPWVNLFYKRAGILKEELGVHHMGPDDGPVQHVDVTQDELERIRQALVGETAGSSPAG